MRSYCIKYRILCDIGASQNFAESVTDLWRSGAKRNFKGDFPDIDTQVFHVTVTCDGIIFDKYSGKMI